ncbi:MAG: hypothetical protein AAB364_01590 [Patescibacteria group bacterium]
MKKTKPTNSSFGRSNTTTVGDAEVRIVNILFQSVHKRREAQQKQAKAKKRASRPGEQIVFGFAVPKEKTTPECFC